MSHRRVTLPIVLVLAGVLALVGCIPAPTTHQFMTNGNLKPWWKIGKRRNNPVWLGHTTLDQAIVFLSKHVSGSTDRQVIIGDTVRAYVDDSDPRSRWAKIDDHHYSMPYEVRTGLLIWPLCGMITSDSSTSFVILETNDANIVVDFETLSAENYGDRYRSVAKPLVPYKRASNVPASTQIFRQPE